MPGEGRGDHAPLRGKERRDERPPVGVRGPAVEEQIRPGLPRSPQARTSTFAPSTSMNVRSGSFAIASSNHNGAGGLAMERR